MRKKNMTALEKEIDCFGLWVGLWKVTVGRNDTRTLLYRSHMHECLAQSLGKKSAARDSGFDDRYREYSRARLACTCIWHSGWLERQQHAVDIVGDRQLE